MLRSPDFASRWELLVGGGEPLAPDADGKYQSRPWWTDNHRKELENRARGRWADWDDRKLEYFNHMLSVRQVVGTIIASRIDAGQEVEF
jgi:hypothetical protein